MDKKSKIAIIVSSLNSGGAERIAGALSVYLSYEYEVYLFLEKCFGIVYDYKGQIVDVGKDGFDYIECNIKEAKREYCIDVSISFMEMFNYMNIRTRQDDAVIISERAYLPLIQQDNLYDHFLRDRLYPLADSIVAISKGVEQKLLENLEIDPKRVTTIYNFCDAQRIRSMAKGELTGIEELYFEQYHVIVSVGRLVLEKNHVRLLRQFKYVYEIDELSRLIIVGSGELLNELIELEKQLCIQDVVLHIPYCSNPFPIIKRSKVFVFSSISEGYGNAILEAMALGVPVVSVDCLVGPREILDDDENYSKLTESWKIAKRGLLTTPDLREDYGETRYLAEAILCALENGTSVSETVNNAMEWVLNRSNLEMLKKWKKVIERAIVEKHCMLGGQSSSFVDDGKANYIYGAGEFAGKLFRQLKKEGIVVDGFIVTNRKGNPSKLNGLPVVQIDSILKKNEGINAFIGIKRDRYAKEAYSILSEQGITVLDNPVVDFE